MDGGGGGEGWWLDVLRIPKKSHHYLTNSCD